MCGLEAWISWPDLSWAGIQKGKEAWPSVQQPVLRGTPVVTPTRVCPKNGSSSKGFLWVSASGQGLGLSSCHLGGVGVGERAQVLGLIGTPGREGPGRAPGEDMSVAGP